MDETKKHVCSICQVTYTGFGNNAEPVTRGRCCDSCNSSVVLPERIRRMYLAVPMGDKE
jgi:hypothetical protein